MPTAVHISASDSEPASARAVADATSESPVDRVGGDADPSSAGATQSAWMG
jgi:hypothetical protein